MLNIDSYNAFCRALPHATHVVQWGGAHVWKVGGKVFAICWQDAPVGHAGGVSPSRRATEGAKQDNAPELLVTFKCSPMSFDLLKEQPGLRPAPYLASRGLKWIQRTNQDSMDDSALHDYLTESHRIVAAGLPKRMQAELGLVPAEAVRKPGSKSRPKPAPASQLKKQSQPRDTRDLRGGNQ